MQDRACNLPNFSFVLPKKLAGCGVLGSWRPLALELSELRDYGITAIVSLTEWPLDEEQVKENGFAYLHLPVPDYNIPTAQQVKELCAFIDQQLELPQKQQKEEQHDEQRTGAVVVHCFGGSGRTGTMLAVYLLHYSFKKRKMEEIGEEGLVFDGEKAIQLVRSLRPRSVETKAQEDVVHQWAEYLDTCSKAKESIE
ncbi:Dual specificity phosphatase, catalytic domain containing protein [Balamuthia mandrillaris]